MGQIDCRKVIVMAASLLVTSCLLYGIPSPKAITKQTPLRIALSKVDGWKSQKPWILEPEIVRSLEVDDYFFQDYSNGLEKISLYVGYYLSYKKIGAAHDPMVCFPGQGWRVSNIQEGIYFLNQRAEKPISYSMMTVQRGGEKHLIIYWFQVGDYGTSNTFYQKLISIRQKMFRGREDNAFVRISTSVEGKTIEEGREILLDFIERYYPIFLDYVRG